MKMLGREGKQTLLCTSASSIDGSYVQATVQRPVCKPTSVSRNLRDSQGLEDRGSRPQGCVSVCAPEHCSQLCTGLGLHSHYPSQEPFICSIPSQPGSLTGAGSLECHGHHILKHVHQLP